MCSIIVIDKNCPFLRFIHSTTQFVKPPGVTRWRCNPKPITDSSITLIRQSIPGDSPSTSSKDGDCRSFFVLLFFYFFCFDICMARNSMSYPRTIHDELMDILCNV